MWSLLQVICSVSASALTGLPAVNSRAWLARCLAELGAFPEGIAHGEEAVRIAEAVDHPNSLIHAYLGVGFLSLRTGGPLQGHPRARTLP